MNKNKIIEKMEEKKVNKTYDPALGWINIKAKGAENKKELEAEPEVNKDVKSNKQKK